MVDISELTDEQIIEKIKDKYRRKENQGGKSIVKGA